MSIIFEVFVLVAALAFGCAFLAAIADHIGEVGWPRSGLRATRVHARRK